MARLSDVYGITKPAVPEVEKRISKAPAGKAVAVVPKAAKERVAVARAAVAKSSEAALPKADGDQVKFLMKLSGGMAARLEGRRREMGLRSRAETIRALLAEALGEEGR